jgi:hypothetical protein
MLGRSHGLFDRSRDPFALSRIPFEINAQTLRPPGVERALAVLASLAPPHARWLAEQLLAFDDAAGVWMVSYTALVATPSRNPTDPPLTQRTDRFHAIHGVGGLPSGLHRIDDGGSRRLLHRRAL